MNVASLSAPGIDRIFHQGNIHGTHLCYRLGHLQGHNAFGRIKSIKHSTDTIGNRNRELPVCSAVPHPTTPFKYDADVIKDVTVNKCLSKGMLFLNNLRL
jgi:hypothetical protein